MAVCFFAKRASALVCLVCLATAPFAVPATAGPDSWTAIGPVAYPFAVDPSAPSTIYAVVNHNAVVDPSPSSPRTIFPSVSGNTVAKTTDGGGHWSDLAVLAPDEVNSLAIDPRASATIYASLGDPWDPADVPIYKSMDGGANWAAAVAGFNDAPTSVVAIAPSLSSTLYAGASDAVFKSIDGGLSWERRSNGLPGQPNGFYISALAIDPTNADVVYVAQTVAGFPSGPDTGKIFKSTDGGGQWRQVPIPVPAPVAISSLAIDPATPSIVYAAYGPFGADGSGGVLKSIDAGETWIAAQNGLPDTILMSALAIDPTAPSRIYAGTSGGVFMSTDAAASWTPINAGLTNLHIWSLSIDRTGSILRAATAGGLFEYLVTPAATEVQTAIEYGLTTVWDYGGYFSYFVTSSPAEIAALDAGALDGCCGYLWQRTGETFDVWTSPAGGALPTCRFLYAIFSIDRNISTLNLDHFYTPYSTECAAVRAHPDWHWQFEGVAFYLRLPGADGHCPPGTNVLYRLYNKGIDGGPAHRFTTTAATIDEMLAVGWTIEGNGPTFAFACVPSSAPRLSHSSDQPAAQFVPAIRAEFNRRRDAHVLA